MEEESEERGLDVIRSSGVGDIMGCVVVEDVDVDDWREGKVCACGCGEVEEGEPEDLKKDKRRLSEIIPTKCGLCTSVFANVEFRINTTQFISI